jgi:hypothetical protein
MQPEKGRVFIVGTGRSGSSLLSAILADAGVDFGVPNVSGWDRSSGAFEHPLLISACKWFLRARKVSLISDRAKRFCESKMEQELVRLLQKVEFSKYPAAIDLIHVIPKLGYVPKVIVSYRNFDSYSMSAYLKNGGNITRLAYDYVETNNTALLQLNVFGGCSVSYEEVIDLEETDWAQSIADLTGLDFERILKSREKRALKPSCKREQMISPIVHREAIEMTYSRLNQTKGKILESKHLDKAI